MPPSIDSLRRGLRTVVTPARRDLVIFIIGLLLLASPALVALEVVGASEYKYESVEVVPTDTGIEVADGDSLPPGMAISEDIACSGTLVDRACALERQLVDNETASFGYTVSELESTHATADPPYPYVLLDDTVYFATTTMNESAATDDGTAILEASLSPAIPTAVLASVSLDADDDAVSSVLVEAAEEGEATASRHASVPETTIELDDGTYHRVYLTDETPAGTGSVFVALLFFTTAFGLIILLSLSRNLSISYRPKER